MDKKELEKKLKQNNNEFTTEEGILVRYIKKPCDDEFFAAIIVPEKKEWWLRKEESGYYVGCYHVKPYYDNEKWLSIEASDHMDCILQALKLFKAELQEEKRAEIPKIKLKKIEEGVCPYCGSLDVNFGSEEFTDECLYYNAKCNSCGKDFQEWYRLSFDGHSVGKNGDYIDLDPGQEGVEIEDFEPHLKQDETDTKKNKPIGTFEVDVELQADGNLDAFISTNDGGSGIHLKDTDAQKVGERLMEEIQNSTILTLDQELKEEECEETDEEYVFKKIAEIYELVEEDEFHNNVEAILDELADLQALFK